MKCILIRYHNRTFYQLYKPSSRWVFLFQNIVFDKEREHQSYTVSNIEGETTITITDVNNKEKGRKENRKTSELANTKKKTGLALIMPLLGPTILDQDSPLAMLLQIATILPPTLPDSCYFSCSLHFTQKIYDSIKYQEHKAQAHAYRDSQANHKVAYLAHNKDDPLYLGSANTLLALIAESNTGLLLQLLKKAIV